MADRIATAVLLESGNIRTPKGRLIYTDNLFKPGLPRGEKDESKAKYQITILVPKASDIKVMRDAVEEAIADNVSEKARKTTKVKTPFLKTEDYPRLAELAEDFPVMIRCSSNYKPEVVGPTNRAITEDEEADEVYGGRWGRLSVRPYFYDHPTGGKGVSFGLQNVQLLDHDEPIAGGRARAETEFESVGDGLDGLE